MEIFRALNNEEIDTFQKWADDNYIPLAEIDGTWHPVIQARCVAINESQNLQIKG